MKKVLCLLCGALLFLSAPDSVAGQSYMTEDLENKLDTEGVEWIPLNIRLKEQVDQNLLRSAVKSIACKDERRAFVIDTLKSHAKNSQAELLVFLEALKEKNKIKDLHTFWLVNSVYCRAKPSAISALSGHPDIERLDYDKKRFFTPDDMERLDNGDADSRNLSSDIQPDTAWHISTVNAAQSWKDGFFGQDVVVAIIDTGVNYEAEDLEGRMWEHPDYPNHGYNFVGNNDDPMDGHGDGSGPSGHGTAVAGVVAGQGRQGLITGIAPRATIMAVKVISATGGTESNVMQGVEFAMNQGADIMNVSLGAPQSANPDRVGFRILMDNVLNAGVIASVSSGNHGNHIISPPYEVGTPGDIPPPWLHPDQTLEGGTSAVVSVGATADTDTIADFSSCGPVIWEEDTLYDDYPYDPSMGLIRPDIVAPGQGITTITINTPYDDGGYADWSGTSFSAPAVAGAMAILLSKYPTLTPEEISMTLETNAVPLSESKSNVYGSGMLNVGAAVEATPYRGIKMVNYEVDDSHGNDDGELNPGEFIQLDVTLGNPTDEQFENIEAALKTSSDYIHIIDSIGEFGDLLPGESHTRKNAFSFEVAENIPTDHTVVFKLVKPTHEGYPKPVWKTAFSEDPVAPHVVFSDIHVDNGQHNHPDGNFYPGETSVLEVKLENQGKMAAVNTVVEINTDKPYISLPGGNQASVDYIENGGEVIVTFPVFIHEDVALGGKCKFFLEIQHGGYFQERTYQKNIGMTENWWSGDFETFNWEFQGDAPWVLDDDNAYNNTYAARSGDIGHNQNSTLKLAMDVLSDDTISFKRKVSSEVYDVLEFYINDKKKGIWSGEEDWARVSFPVEQGLQTFRWVYEKDFMVSEGDDCAWIDRIDLPAPSNTWAFAGFDMESDPGEPLALSGFASRYDEVVWHSDGEGAFDDPGQLQTSYYPATYDNQEGKVSLTLTAYYEQEQASHTMQVFFDGGLSVEDKDMPASGMTLSPNPARGYTTIYFPDALSGDVAIELLNVHGFVEYLVNLPDSEGKTAKTIHLEHLNPGIYFIRIRKDGVIVDTEKLMLY